MNSWVARPVEVTLDGNEQDQGASCRHPGQRRTEWQTFWEKSGHRQRYRPCRPPRLYIERQTADPGSLRWLGKTGQNWVLTSQTHGKSPSHETASVRCGLPRLILAAGQRKPFHAGCRPRPEYRRQAYLCLAESGATARARRSDRGRRSAGVARRQQTVCAGTGHFKNAILLFSQPPAP